jgi:hypothetical protein
MPRRKSFRKYLRQQRLRQYHQDGVEATGIEARLGVHLGDEQMAVIERRWREMPDTEAYLPSQRRDFLVDVAAQYGISLAGIQEAGWTTSE